MKQVFLLLFSFAFLSAFSQLEDRIWIFGRPTQGNTNATLYFGNLSNPVTTLPTLTQPHNITVNNGFEKWCVVTSPNTGELVFYTDGVNVFDNLHQIVDLDTTTTFIEPLGANHSSAQPVAVAVEPKYPFENYFIFLNPTGALHNMAYVEPLVYRIYNTVSKSFSNAVPLPGPYGAFNVTEGMKIVRSESDPHLMWLIKSLYPYSSITNRYVVYKIYQNQISYHNYFDFGPSKISTTTSFPASPILNIKYTNAADTTGISTVGFALQHSSRVFVCKFNNTTGDFLLHTYKEYNPGYFKIPAVYDIEFSPNGRFLYYSVYRTAANTNTLFQIDLDDIVLLPVTVKTFNAEYAGGLQIGPDGLIYHVHDGGLNSNTIRLGRVLQPDTKFIQGTTNVNSFYQENFQVYNNMWGIALSEFLVNPYPITSGIVEKDNSPDINIFPNPISDFVTIQADATYNISLYDIHGRIIHSSSINGTAAIDLSQLSSGLYLLQLQNSKNNIYKKVVKK